MTAEIITIGDEILLGQTIDTNSAYLGKQLHSVGVDLIQITSISDKRNAIVNAIEQALIDVDLVLVTGGLGPTKDDITKHVLCEIFNTKLVRNTAVQDKIAEYFSNLGREMLEVNAQQADLPEKAEIFTNDLGTAQGMMFERNGKYLLSMPGVPYEMKHIVDTGLMPFLESKLSENKLYYRTVVTKDIFESFLAQKLETWENNLRAEGISLAYLPSPGLVKLRVSTGNANAETKAKVDAYVNELSVLIPENIFSYEDISVDKAIIQLLIENNRTFSVAESCTGGNMAKTIVKHSGVSEVFLGGMVTYSNQLKIKLLKVLPTDIEQYGAVSKPVVCQMAKEMQSISGSDYALSTSGIAGPTGGSDAKPVGLVHMAIAAPNGQVYHFEKVFGGDRERIINRASQYLFSKFYDVLVKRA
jgi:nicotinamide-nucleotide amidase